MARSDFSMELFGLSELTAKLGQLRGQAREIAADEMYRGAQEILAASREIVPVETGALRDSGFADRPETHGDLIALEVGYGGPTADYALYVHEGTSKMAARKFLERPTLELYPGIVRGIGHRLGRELR